VLTTETRRDGTLLERVHDGVGRTEELLHNDVHSTHHLGHQEVLSGTVEGGLALLPGLGTAQTGETDGGGGSGITDGRDDRAGGNGGSGESAGAEDAGGAERGHYCEWS
jgi:hypothetical protein